MRCRGGLGLLLVRPGAVGQCPPCVVHVAVVATLYVAVPRPHTDAATDTLRVVQYFSVFPALILGHSKPCIWLAQAAVVDRFCCGLVRGSYSDAVGGCPAVYLGCDWRNGAGRRHRRRKNRALPPSTHANKLWEQPTL